MKNNSKTVNIRLGGHGTHIPPGVISDKHWMRGIGVELEKLRVTLQHLGGSPQLTAEVLMTVLRDIP